MLPCSIEVESLVCRLELVNVCDWSSQGLAMEGKVQGWQKPECVGALHAGSLVNLLAEQGDN